MMKRIVCTLLAAASVAASQPAAAQTGAVKVTGGQVSGAVADGVTVYKGIPFAAPPVGALRWRAPQPVKPWSGVRPATAFAPPCMQASSPFASFREATQPGEDCLYLNVWTPAKSAGEKLPVMVWIYGGAFSGGGTSIATYDGARLAQKGVVLVSIAYRVGPFGFLAHPELSRESGKGSGNFGLQDQIAGLKWVQANIARFGGDPAKVTIFGESAGGIAVSMLAASPYAKGLFARAISESGGNFGPPKYDSEGGVNVPPLKVAEAAGQSFFAQLGAADLKAARALPADRIQTASGQFWPTFDGDVLPGDQHQLYEAGRFNDTPVLIGTNSDEGALFVREATAASFVQQIRAGYGPKADAILAAYPHGDDAQAFQSSKDIFRDTAFAWHTWSWARLQSQKGRGKAFVYYFDQRLPDMPSGATHAAEIGYVFGNLGGMGFSSAPPRPQDRTVSDLMMNYWVNFARTGDPNGPGLPAWPVYQPANEQVLLLRDGAAAQPYPNVEKLKVLDDYYAWRRSEAAKR